MARHGGFAFINSGAAVAANGVVPEVISPGETVIFNNVTPFWVNESPSFLDQQSVLEYPGLYWGTFDGSTNAPILYPNGSSVSDLTAALFNGSNGGSQGTQANTWYGLSLGTNTAAGVAGQ